VNYYLGSAHNATNITDAVVGGTYTTSPMAAGAITGKNTMIRMEIQAIDVPTGMTNNVPVTVTSVSVPSLSDTVIVNAF
jgi:hypothetical protein